MAPIKAVLVEGFNRLNNPMDAALHHPKIFELLFII